MKKRLCLVMVCMLIFAMSVSAFAANTYQVGTLSFTTDIELEHSYSDSEMTNISDDDFFEFTSKQLGRDEWVDDDGTEMWVDGELEICIETSVGLWDDEKEEEITFSGVSEFPSALEAMKKVWEGDTITEVTIDGCPAIVVQHSEKACAIYVYDNTYFYTIELDTYEEEGYKEIYDDLLKAKLNCTKIVGNENTADDTKDNKDTVSNEKNTNVNETENNNATANNNVVNSSSNNTLFIVVVVVVIVVIVGAVVVLLKRKK